MKLQFDIERIKILKDIILRLRGGEPIESIQLEMDTYFKDVSDVDFLLTVQELINGDNDLTVADGENLLNADPYLFDKIVNGKAAKAYHPGHPVPIFKEENKTFQSIVDRINFLLEMFEKSVETGHESDVMEELKHLIFRLGEIHKHLHRKEKLFFPMMERYGYYNPIRMMWRVDDRIRALYQGAKRQINRLPDVKIEHVRQTYDAFEKDFKQMIFEEEMIIMPVLSDVFQEDDWLAIAKESDAFGYAANESEEEWAVAFKCEQFIESHDQHEEMKTTVDNKLPTKELPFGGGYLTAEEANLILNHLPLEITFVDKHSVFKYFNEITEASDMMLVRTPISIGRNVANCHPPKSLRKVMTLIRDLKAKKRTSESMWFKKRDQYIHLTYKAIFNEEDEYMGILEYVQDIQPFFNLPSDVKRRLSQLEE